MVSAGPKFECLKIWGPRSKYSNVVFTAQYHLVDSVTLSGDAQWDTNNLYCHFERWSTMNRPTFHFSTSGQQPNPALPSVQGYSFLPAHQNVSSLCTPNTFPPHSNDASFTEMNTQFWTLLCDISATSRKVTINEQIFHKPRHLLFAKRDIVDAQVDDWVENGIVVSCSSPYASQVVVVKKKDGISRVCIDYRRLNRKLIKDNYPLPLLDDILDRLQNAKIFTIDLKNGFFHVVVNERSCKFTSFVTHNGQFQFRRMPFGLSTCPPTFMRYINDIFQHLISKSIVHPCMDDVILATNESEALEYLKIVLKVACDYGLEKIS
ncbi:hypothetical protein TNIN_374471 [Trichonephila inaurata madagascariensis]|uniref:Reverse transcriptase domain-containing protein n=1 Tax=Trichonephila inaurata madagascariensis TaxID=2747483 RepID=A0A8X7BUX6_9ARAC|nr:hypothetical protein TNIN_374471 [Trichonephila inaurata madagascariensis]